MTASILIRRLFATTTMPSPSPSPSRDIINKTKKTRRRKRHRNNSNVSFLLYTLASIIFFWLGFWDSSSSYDDDDVPTSNNYPIGSYNSNSEKENERNVNNKKNIPSSILEEQKNAQTTFLNWIYQTQEQRGRDSLEGEEAKFSYTETYFCSSPRTLTIPMNNIKALMKDDNDEQQSSWYKSIDYLATSLQIALATERRLVIPLSVNEDFGVEENGNHNDSDQDSFLSMCKNIEYDNHTTVSSRRVFCQWKNLIIENKASTSCQNNNLQSIRQQRQIVKVNYIRDGILIGVNSSDFFNTKFYGPSKDVIVPSSTSYPKTWLIDTLHWERRYGSFWVRSQILHYLNTNLKLIPTTAADDDAESSINKKSLSVKEQKQQNTSNKVVEISILIDDNAQRILQQQFSRNATKSHNIQRIIDICQYYYYEEYYHNNYDHYSFTEEEHSSTMGRKIGKMQSQTLPLSPPPPLSVYIARKISYCGKDENNDDDDDDEDDLLSIFQESWKKVERRRNIQVSVTTTTSTKGTNNDDDTTNILNKMIHSEVIIGSFASPFFRLGASLNFAYHIGTYPISQRRIWPLDIEWIPDLQTT